MPPLQKGQRTLHGFFKPYTETRKRDATAQESLASASSAPGTPKRKRDASTRAEHARKFVLSPKRRWDSPDMRKRRDEHVAPLSPSSITARPLGPPAVPQTDNTIIHDTIHVRPRGAVATTSSKNPPSRRQRQQMKYVDNPTRRIDGDGEVEATMHDPMPTIEFPGSNEYIEGETAALGLNGANHNPSRSMRASHQASPAPPTRSRSRSSSSEPTFSFQRAQQRPTSSLTTLPDTTPSFGSSSAKRISRDGMEMVVNSDSDSEDDELLEDLDVIVARENAKRKPKANAMPTLPTPVSATTSKGRSLRSGNSATITTVEKTPMAKFKTGSLSTKFARGESDDDDDDGASLHSLSEGDEDLQRIPAAVGVDVDDLEALMPDREDEPGEARRVFDIMQRNEAFKDDLVYYYFDPKRNVDINPPAFPTASLDGKHGILKMLRKPAQRQQVFSSGLAAKLLEQQPLPVGVLMWMMDSLCVGTSELLSLHYLEVLDQSKPMLQGLIDETFIGRQLDVMGRRQQDTRLDRDLLASRSYTERRLPRGLRWFLELLRMLAGNLDPQSTQCAIESLCDMLVDSQVQQDGFHLTLIHDVLADLLRAADNDSVRAVEQTLFDTKRLPSLQETLVQSLPASDGAAHDFRRRLAYAFTLNIPSAAIPDFDALGTFSIVTQHVQDLSKHSRDPEQTTLSSTIPLLDIAIDAGFSDHTFAAGSEKEKAFNDAVSKLAAAVRELESGLIGGGLSNLHKTTAKAACDRLWCRLQYSVRTTPPPQKDYFGALGGLDGEQEKKVRFMSKWANIGKVGVGDG